ncbi:MAG: aminotransferase class I/II-fold pyridoxal phosphate-dependent enzyme [Acidimicrobiales bacterium]
MSIETSRTVPPPGPHGGDGPAIAAALGLDPSTVLDLSQTLNPFAPDVAAIAARHLDTLGTYPDRREATERLAAELGIDADRLLLTNGGSEAIRLVAAELGGSVVSEPEFGLHPRSSGAVRWRSDPHSPSGLLARPGDEADVWDEAFYALATGRWTARRPGTVTVGSLTKLFACPGLRLGYVIADDVDRFARHQPGWPVSSLALAVLPQLLAAADLPGWAASITSTRARTAAVLARHGLHPQPSDAPWLLVRAPGLRERLAPSGVIVRDCASFGLPGVTRVAVVDGPELDRLDRALHRSPPLELP